MAGKVYQDGLWISQGDVALVNEEATEVGVAAAAGAVKQFAAGQLGKKICLPDPTNSGSLVPKEYRYVRRDEATTLNATPCVMAWADPTDLGLFTVELASTFTGGQVPAGFFLGDDTAAVGQRGMQDGNFGFIQVGGHIQVPCGGVVTAGADVTYDASGLIVNRTAFTEPLVAVALESGTTNDDVWVLISLVTTD